MAVSSRCGWIARLVLLKTESQQGAHGSAPWRIGEGFMQLDNMFLARLKSASKGSWQPEIWVVDPVL